MSFSKLKKAKISSQTLAIWSLAFCVPVVDVGIVCVFPKTAFGQSLPPLYNCLRTFSLTHSLKIFFTIPFFILFILLFLNYLLL